MNALLETTAKTPVTFSGREASKSGRILVADDDESIRYLEVEVLSRLGYEVDEAENGNRAWKALQGKHYDLIITDQDMPEVTGLQLIHKLRLAGFETSVILASGRLSSNSCLTTELVKLGATTLSKPFTLDELTTTVERLLPKTTPEFHTTPWQLLPKPILNQTNYATK